MNEERKSKTVLIEEKYESALKSLIKKMQESVSDDLHKPRIIVLTAKEMEASRMVVFLD